jgi:hypothetical protein
MAKRPWQPSSAGLTITSIQEGEYCNIYQADLNAPKCRHALPFQYMEYAASSVTMHVIGLEDSLSPGDW